MPSVPGRLVDPLCPIDWSHPLNRGLVANWQAGLPGLGGWTGGLTWRDLVRGAKPPRDATLNGLAFPATSTSGWAGPTGRPGGFGALACDGVNDYASSSANMGGLAAASWAVWVRMPAAGGSDFGAWLCGNTGYSASFYLGSDVTPTGQAFFGSVKVTFSFSRDDRWYRIVCVYRGGTSGRVYRNGVSLTGSSSSIPATLPSHTGVQIGGNSSGGYYARAAIDDVRLWSRALSDSEVRAEYEESRAGRPETLRWLPTRAWSIPAAGGGGGGGNRRRRALLLGRN
jgi:hypothetical protein